MALNNTIGWVYREVYVSLDDDRRLLWKSMQENRFRQGSETLYQVQISNDAIPPLINESLVTYLVIFLLQKKGKRS